MMNASSEINNIPTDVIFLGICERADYVREANTGIFKWNILGLRTIILSHIFPLRIDGGALGLAFRAGALSQEIKLRLSDDSYNEIGTLNLALQATSPESDDAVLREGGPIVLAPTNQWSTVFLSLEKIGWIITKPGTYFLEQFVNESYISTGSLHFGVVDAPPLSPDRIAAIKSTPNAAKAVRFEIRCKSCPTKLRAYAALGLNPKLEADGWVWYETLPDYFKCQCGQVKIDLKYMRRNLHGLLGHSVRDESGLVHFMPLYEKSSLESIRSNFARLIERDPREELLQKFIEENPIVLHQFPAVRIISKPPILTSYVADFGIVTPQKELILIELEKTTTRIMKQDGGIAASLSHAFDQVRDWLHEVDEHRLAVLDTLRIERNEVSNIRAVVVAGRDVGYDARNLRKLKGNNWGRVTLLTYDDVLFSFDTLIRHFGRF